MEYALFEFLNDVNVNLGGFSVGVLFGGLGVFAAGLAYFIGTLETYFGVKDKKHVK